MPPKKVVHKAGEYLLNKVTEAVLSKTIVMQTKSNDDNIEKQETVEEIIIPPVKIEEILNKLRKAL